MLKQRVKSLRAESNVVSALGGMGLLLMTLTGAISGGQVWSAHQTLTRAAEAAVQSEQQNGCWTSSTTQAVDTILRGDGMSPSALTIKQSTTSTAQYGNPVVAAFSYPVHVGVLGFSFPQPITLNTQYQSTSFFVPTSPGGACSTPNTTISVTEPGTGSGYGSGGSGSGSGGSGGNAANPSTASSTPWTIPTWPGRHSYQIPTQHFPTQSFSVTPPITSWHSYPTSSSPTYPTYPIPTVTPRSSTSPTYPIYPITPISRTYPTSSTSPTYPIYPTVTPRSSTSPTSPTSPTYPIYPITPISRTYPTSSTSPTNLCGYTYGLCIFPPGGVRY